MRLARVTASGIASRIGFAYDEVEDIRLAVDELCFALVGPGQVGGVLEVRFEVEGDTLAIRGRTTPGSRAEVTPLTERILAHLVDEWSLIEPDGDVGPGFLLKKRRK